MRISDWSSDVCSSDLQVLVHTAGPEVGRVHARSADPLVELHQLLALFEAPQQRRHGADVEREGGDVQQVVEDAADLGEEHADVRSEEHTSELQSLMRSSYAVFCLKKKQQPPEHDYLTHTSP